MSDPSEPAAAEPAVAGPTAADPAASEPTAADPAAPEPTAADSVGSLACPVCGMATEAGDEFCEACGASLATTSAGAAPKGPDPAPAPDRPADAGRPSDASPAGGNGTRQVSTPTTPGGPYGRTLPCVGCGAPPAAIAADGYCTECGLLQPGPREHVEVDLGWAAGVTDRGRHHPRNEDAFHLELVGLPEERSVVAVVCDGVSSSVKADEASELAAQAAATLLAAVVAGPGSLADATVHAADAANRVVAALPWTATGRLASPSCTLVSAACRGDDVAIGWVGDSRAYWVDRGAGKLSQLTVDDSWAEAQISAGRLTEAEADADPRSHAITRWIGADAPTIDAQVATMSPTAGGRLLLCSDGLWNYAPTVQAMADLLANHADATTPIQLAEALTEFARDAGGHDNITVVVIDFPESFPEKGTP